MRSLIPAALVAALLAMPAAAQEIHRTALDHMVAAACLPFAATEDTPAAVVWRAETSGMAVIHYLADDRIYTHAVSEADCLTPIPPETGRHCQATRASVLANEMLARALCAAGE